MGSTLSTDSRVSTRSIETLTRMGTRSLNLCLNGVTSTKTVAIKSGIRYLQRDQSREKELIMNSHDLWSIWLSFQFFLACYAAESLCLVIGTCNSSHCMPLLCVRASYFAMAVGSSALLHR